MRPTPDDATTPAPAIADLWFDPFCPWAWITSRWLLEVEGVRPVRVRWHVMSLGVLNEDKEVPEHYRDRPQEYRDLLQASWGPVRVCTAAEQRFGAQVLGPLYTAMGTRFHDRGEPRTHDTVAAALAEAGLPEDLAGAAETTEYDEALRTSHFDGMNRVGQEVGTPVVSVDGVSFFGPVVSPAPRGEAAGRLWDGVLLVAGTDGFFELKRSRTRDPVFD